MHGSFTNENGLRVQKTINGVATKYTLHGKNVVHMTSGTDELHFFYDAQNRPAVVVYNGTAYAYVKSLQGDIVAILDENGNTVVSYGYDAWGAPLWCTGELAETLGKVQPFRYRGYVFDEETGLYYNNYRFYSIQWNRFISPDSVFDDNAGVLKHNIYAYVANNSTNNSDSSGHWIFKDAFNWFTENVTKPIVEGVQSLLDDVNLTFSIGFAGSISLGFWTYSFQIGVSFDTHGNIAAQTTGSVALTTGTPGTSAGVYVSVTNAPNVSKLNKEALSIGVSASNGYMVGVDVNIIPDADENDTYYGATVMLGVGTPGGEFHIGGGYTWTIAHNARKKTCLKEGAFGKKGFDRIAMQ